MQNQQLATWANRHADDIAAIATGYRSLIDRGLVMPMAISLNIETSGRLAWSWYKYKALPSHPHPRNASRGYTHPDSLDAVNLSANKRGGPTIVTREDVADADEADLNKYIVLPILKAIGYEGFGKGDTEFGTEWETIFAWHGDRSDGVLNCIDLTRGRVNPWATYPSVDAQPETEINPDFEQPVIHYGGEPERERVRRVLRDETQSTDAFMQRVAA